MRDYGTIETQVHSATLPAYRRYTKGKMTLNRMGNPIRMDWKQALVNDGRGYMLANASPDLVVSGSVNYAATDPVILMVVPSGFTIMPFCVTVALENATGDDNWVSIGFDTGDLYTSGGEAVALIVNNLRSDSPYGSSVCKAYSGGTAIVMVDPAAGERMIFHWVDPFAATDKRACGVVQWEPKYCPVLVGPASFFVYVYAATTAPDIQCGIQWVEFESEALPE